MRELRNSNNRQRRSVLWLTPPDFFSLLPYPGPPIQDGTTHGGLGSPIPIIIKKMAPACLQATVVEADVLFWFSQLKFPLFRRSYLAWVKLTKKWPAQSFTPGENIRAWPLWARAISYSYVSVNIQCPNNVTHGYLSKRNQSPFRTCKQMRSVSILLAQKVSKTNIHWWRDKSKVATQNKTKTNPSH